MDRPREAGEPGASRRSRATASALTSRVVAPGAVLNERARRDLPHFVGIRREILKQRALDHLLDHDVRPLALDDGGIEERLPRVVRPREMLGEEWTQRLGEGVVKHD